MNAAEVCSSFGCFVKIVLRKDQSPSCSVETVNVFNILMASQRRLCMPSLPNRVVEKINCSMILYLYLKVLERSGPVVKYNLVNRFSFYLDECPLVY